jgi:hypothetical protein
MSASGKLEKGVASSSACLSKLLADVCSIWVTDLFVLHSGSQWRLIPQSCTYSRWREGLPDISAEISAAAAADAAPADAVSTAVSVGTAVVEADSCAASVPKQGT